MTSVPSPGGHGNPRLDCRYSLLEKNLMLGKIEGKMRRGWQRVRWLESITDSMAIEQTPGGSGGQGSLACCSPWGCKESDTTWLLNNSSWRCLWVSFELNKKSHWTREANRWQSWEKQPGGTCRLSPGGPCWSGQQAFNFRRYPAGIWDPCHQILQGWIEIQFWLGIAWFLTCWIQKEGWGDMSAIWAKPNTSAEKK